MLDRDCGLLYMKIGTHAQEELPEIIERKKLEIEKAGFAMWGYGGNTCHPSTKVQPFAKAHASQGKTIILCMEKMDSGHLADPVRAEEYSIDGTRWESVPPEINVRGSRYALLIDSLEEVEEELNLAETVVAVGNSKGKRGSDYIKGRVDKACLDLVAEDGTLDEDLPGDLVPRQINLVAKIIDPYAVFLRN